MGLQPLPLRLLTTLAMVLLVSCTLSASPRPEDRSAAGQFTHPIAQYTPDPIYTSRAAAHHASGSVVLRILIGPDGCAHRIHIVRRLGWGLDQAAVSAVRAWRFRRPRGVRTGVPARIQISFSPAMLGRPADDLTPCTEVQ